MDQTSLLYFPPTAPPMRDSARNLVYSINGVPVNNPLAFDQYRYDALTRTLVCNVQVLYNVGRWELQINSGYSSIDTRESTTIPATAQNPLFAPADLRYLARTNLKGGEGSIKLSWRWGGERMNFSATGGLDWYIQHDRIEAPGDTVGTAQLESLSGSTVADYRDLGSFFSGGASFDQRFFMNVTGRWDKSSRMARDDGGFYSGGAGLSYVFFRPKATDPDKTHVLTMGRLHVSCGITGSDAVQNYAHYTGWSTFSGALPAQLAGAFYPTSPSNVSLTWERIVKSSVGLTLGFINDQLNMDLVYYRQRASDLPVPYTLPATTGFSTGYRTWPAVIMNTGYELSIQKQAKAWNFFQWMSRLSLSFPRNKLQSYPNIENSYYATTRIVGEPREAVRLYHYIGVDPQTGLFAFEDYDGDGKITEKDRQFIGKPMVKMFSAWTNAFHTGKWRLEMTLEGVVQTGIDYQRDIYNVSPPGSLGPGLFNNETVKVLDHWRKPGDKARYQQFTSLPTTEAAQRIPLFTSSSGILENASFLRLRTLTLSYEIPTAFFHKLNLKMGGQFYIQGQNLLTLTPYADVDPALQSGMVCPLVKSYGVGVKLNFNSI